jgi:hypothetical protein
MPSRSEKEPLDSRRSPRALWWLLALLPVGLSGPSNALRAISSARSFFFYWGWWGRGLGGGGAGEGVARRGFECPDASRGD